MNEVDNRKATLSNHKETTVDTQTLSKNDKRKNEIADFYKTLNLPNGFDTNSLPMVEDRFSYSYYMYK